MNTVSDDISVATPMMAQYLEIKAQLPRTRSCSTGWAISTRCSLTMPWPPPTALDIALTKRGFHLGQEPIAMCGVPVHAAEGYLLTLIRKGFRVAIAEQMEDPAEAKKRGSKSVVAARCGAVGHARHPDRGFPPGSAAAQLPGRYGPRCATRRPWPGPTSRPASFGSWPAPWSGWHRIWRGWPRANCW